jgi:hypothetical protein
MGRTGTNSGFLGESQKERGHQEDLDIGGKKWYELD